MMHSHVTYVCGPCSYSQRSFALWGKGDREIVRLVIGAPSIENRGAWCVTKVDCSGEADTRHPDAVRKSHHPGYKLGSRGGLPKGW